MKRWAMRILVLLILGAIVNVAVAWGAAMTAQLHTAAIQNDVQPAEVEWLVEAGWIWPVTDDGNPIAVQTEPINGVGTRYCVARAQKGFGFVVEPFGVSLAAGWPRLAVSGALFEADALNNSPGPSRRLGVVSPLTRLPTIRNPVARYAQQPAEFLGTRAQDDGRFLPLRPLWPGFAINTVFYAAVLWLLFAAPFAWRRRMRIKRGLCPKCAYDLRGSESATSPECGAQK